MARVKLIVYLAERPTTFIVPDVSFVMLTPCSVPGSRAGVNTTPVVTVSILQLTLLIVFVVEI